MKTFNQIILEAEEVARELEWHGKIYVYTSLEGSLLTEIKKINLP